MPLVRTDCLAGRVRHTETEKQMTTQPPQGLTDGKALPSPETIARVIHLDDYPGKPELWDEENAILQAEYLRKATAVLKLFAAQPTVAQAKVEGMREAADLAAALDFGPAPMFSRPAAHRWGALKAAERIRKRADEIEPLRSRSRR